MKYKKPELQIVGAAISCIAHPSQKGSGLPRDNFPVTPATYQSINAYAADE